MELAGTNDFFARIDNNGKRSKKCPCCEISEETTEHIVFCKEAGKVEFLMKYAEVLESWLEDVDTDSGLIYCIMEYIERRGTKTLAEICRELGPRYIRLRVSQDKIGWRRFMEGIISKEIIAIQ